MHKPVEFLASLKDRIHIFIRVGLLVEKHECASDLYTWSERRFNAIFVALQMRHSFDVLYEMYTTNLITVVCSLAVGTLLLGSLLAAGVAVLAVLEASLTVEGAVDVLSCRLTLAVVL